MKGAGKIVSTITIEDAQLVWDRRLVADLAIRLRRSTPSHYPTTGTLADHCTDCYRVLCGWMVTPDLIALVDRLHPRSKAKVYLQEMLVAVDELFQSTGHPQKRKRRLQLPEFDRPRYRWDQTEDLRAANNFASALSQYLLRRQESPWWLFHQPAPSFSFVLATAAPGRWQQFADFYRWLALFQPDAEAAGLPARVCQERDYEASWHVFADWCQTHQPQIDADLIRRASASNAEEIFRCELDQLQQAAGFDGL